MRNSDYSRSPCRVLSRRVAHVELGSVRRSSIAVNCGRLSAPIDQWNFRRLPAQRSSLNGAQPSRLPFDLARARSPFLCSIRRQPGRSQARGCWPMRVFRSTMTLARLSPTMKISARRLFVSRIAMQGGRRGESALVRPSTVKSWNG